MKGNTDYRKSSVPVLIGLGGMMLVSVLIVGCHQHDPNYSEPMINGYLYRGEYYNYAIEYERYVEVFDPKGLRMVPVVRLNNEELKPYYYTWTKYGYGDSMHFADNQPYELEVVHYYGKAGARVIMPGNFTVATPPEGYILDLDSTLNIQWTRSAGAEWYWVEIDIEYDYRDTLGEEDNLSLRLDTMLQDTSLVIPPERIFPGYILDVYEGDACVMVWSGNGPAIEPGDRGNVTGAGFGFFNAINEPREKYFFVGAPIAVRRCPDSRILRQEMLRRLKARA
ncbi:MAG: hypothetical protein N2248_02700 [candidate division WOR-3 bacterium]|uniref:DUF4249 family protein n=1 Tax=candidate division WOR-3 bacterium TaxID=2052148 RepID=A0A7C1N961_UNCW3|nr:hypothetical protein [candidate division WOR-3 bacterium]